MTEKITEDRAIEMLGEEAYTKLVLNFYDQCRKEPRWNNGKPNFGAIFSQQIDEAGKAFLIVEVTSKKLTSGLRDFGVTKIYFSDQEMPDEGLDLISTFLKANDKEKS